MKALYSYLLVPTLRRMAMVALLFLAFFAGIEFGVRRPMVLEQEGATANLAALRLKTDALSDRIQNVNAYARHQNTLNVIEEKLTVDVDRSQITTLLSELATRTNTRIVHGASAVGKPRRGITPIEQDLTLEGTYFAIRQFIIGTAAMETLTIVRRIEMSSSQETSLVRANLKLSTLSVKASG